MNGWRLTGVLSLLLAAMALYLLSAQGWDAEGIRLVIRATARTSLVLFALAFTAGAMVELLPSEATRWQRGNRRYLGVSFAVSHLIHAAAIAGFLGLARDQIAAGIASPIFSVRARVLTNQEAAWPRTRSTRQGCRPSQKSPVAHVLPHEPQFASVVVSRQTWLQQP